MRLLIYVIEGITMTADGLALLPGIPPEMMGYQGVDALQHGTEIELQTPDGVIVRTFVHNYYITIPDNASDLNSLQDLPVIIVVPGSIREQNLPIGTEVWLVDR